MRKNSRNIAY